MDHGGGGDESRTFLARSTRFRGASMRKYARDKGTFRGPSDDQDDHGPTVFDRLLFFNMFKNSSRSLFRYPTLGGLRRSRQIFPRRYRVVRDYFRKNAADRPKKGSGTIGTKTILGEMAALDIKQGVHLANGVSKWHPKVLLANTLSQQEHVARQLTVHFFFLCIVFTFFQDYWEKD